MAVQFTLPPIENLVDKQFFQVPGPDGLLAGFQVDKETQTLYQRENQVIIPSHHGFTHISEDPVPDATCDTHGLMPADDKCKLDNLVQMRLGVLGFQGAGFPDDGGFLVGDIILAAGSEFISIERVGNVVRFTVDSPIPLNCGCESCSQIFWIQDESEPSAIRPPSCNGKMPDVSAYGELKIFTLPESIIVDPQNPLDVLNTKGKYPVLLFKRYVNGLTPFENQFEMVLKRNSNGTANVGWAFTPGPTNVAQCVWQMGKDTAGGQIKFELFPESAPGLLGSLLYNGHLITKQPAVIIGYSQNVLADNIYILQKWDMRNAKPIGAQFTARNNWHYFNPTHSPSALSQPQQLQLDSTINILPTGTLVDIYEFEISRNANGRVTRAFFIKEPNLNPRHVWSLGGAISFGDLYSTREEINKPVTGSDLAASEINVSDIRLFEHKSWGLTGFEDRLILSDDGGEVIHSDGLTSREPSGDPINNDIVADIDPTIPGLRVLKQTPSGKGDIDGDGVVSHDDLHLFACAYGSKVGDKNYRAEADFNNDGRVDVRDLAIIGQFFDVGVERVADRPLFLWHRQNHGNSWIRAKIGMPDVDPIVARNFPPFDFLLAAPIDSFGDTYIKVIKRGVFTTGPFAGAPYIVVKGVEWNQLPQQGILRILTGAFRNVVWRYYFKAAFANFDDNGVTLIGRDQHYPFDQDFPITSVGLTGCTSPTAVEAVSAADVVMPTDPEDPNSESISELLRQDFTAPAVRFQFDVNFNTKSEAVQLQIIVGQLDMSVKYALDNSSSPEDDLVRGFAPGYTVSSIMVQQGFINDGIGANIKSNPAAFRVFKGGELPVPVNNSTEAWNQVEIMLRDGQVWIWFNNLLIPPDTKLNAKLPTPVAVNTPYFPIRTMNGFGKVGIRMFPGAILRDFFIRDQVALFNEFTHQQLEITNG